MATQKVSAVRNHLSLSDIESLDKQETDLVREAYVDHLKGWVYYRKTNAAGTIRLLEDRSSGADVVRGMAQHIVDCLCDETGESLYTSSEDVITKLTDDTVIAISKSIIEAGQKERDRRDKVKPGNASRR